MICEAAMMLALALVLNHFKLWEMPQGGSVDFAMVPIFFFALRWGVGWGLIEGFIFGTLQMFIDGAIAWGWQSLLLDYLIAFTPLGVAGLFRGRGKGIFVGITLGCVLRFIVHFISGVTIYAITMPTECLGMTFVNKWTYSLVYNGSYMLLDTIICIVIFALLYKPLDKYIQARDILGK
ncbi:MAG TPA: energy-coupled thiamine transporter ThiT [Candidatus Scatomorpha intestinavium]|uniref:Energy-coupled thiamine transporter ThiT n=1 Tax=Candidatus Scatomorpha intestinavium TaxID=2840922 RepID=A0A9D1CTB1_9FIRM|nr:energy-coupled thiamine transporter ThiT [Candidatus Scatomorpha intestinavium]